jgi:polysaccharide export outer membrane protein
MRGHIFLLLILVRRSSRTHSLTVVARKSFLSRARKQAVKYANVCNLVLAAASLAAQTPDAGFHVRSKQNTISAAEIIRAFEAPEVESYTLGAGDEISVDIWMHPELSGRHVIGPDGKITIPVSGVIPVADLSREETQAAIRDSLAKYYTDLAVTVRVDRYTSFRIFILGRVGTPGAIQFETQPTLLDVVTRAAALPIGGVGSEKAGLGRCAIIRRDRIVWIDLKTLVSEGNLSLNIRLARNDLVYLPDAGDQLVYVLGEVQRPGAFRLTPDMAVLDAFTQAGGLNEDASGDRIELIRTGKDLEKEFRLKDLLAGPTKLNMALQEGDIIYVPRRSLATFGYVLQKASALTGFAIIGSLVK